MGDERPSWLNEVKKEKDKYFFFKEKDRVTCSSSSDSRHMPLEHIPHIYLDEPLADAINKVKKVSPH